MEESKKGSNNAKQMLLQIFEGKRPQHDLDPVYIQDDCDELISESNEYPEPPIVPKSCNNRGGISHAFQQDQTLTSQIPDSQSVGSTVSLQTFAMEPPMEYEEIIQKLEADIRKHIRIQNQLKLHIESLQAKVDEKEKEDGKKDMEIDELRENNRKLKATLIDMDRKREEEIRKIKEDKDFEVRKLNDRIQKLNKQVFEQAKSEERHTMVAGAIPHSSIERQKPIDSARSNNVGFYDYDFRAKIMR